MNPAPQTIFAGIWDPIDANSFTPPHTRGLAFGFQSLVRLTNSDYYGLVVTGWPYTENFVTRDNANISIGFFSPQQDGTLRLNTKAVIPDPITNGAGSVVVADFNSDGREDIFLAAAAEGPFYPRSSTAYLQNQNGLFDKVTIADRISAHGAALSFVNNTPVVVTSTVSDGSSLADQGVVNPIYRFSNGGFTTLTPTKIWYDVARSGNGSWQANQGMSAIIDDFGGAQPYLIRVDNTTFSPDMKVATSDISVYAFNGSDIASTTPLQRITPYLSTRPEYANTPSLWGPGLTHAYRVWADDLNHDGKKDLLVTQSMWRDPGTPYPTALQILINNGTGTFVDQTDRLNREMPLAIEELSYTPTMIDIDRSGIKTLFFSNTARADFSRQSNFVILNDGTGRLYVALHDEFQQFRNSVVQSLASDPLALQASNIANSQINCVDFIAVPLPNGAINFLAEIQTGSRDTPSHAVYAYANFTLNYNPALDFSRSIHIDDRNHSTVMRTWAGNDTFTDRNANVSATRIDGGKGFDRALYSQTLDRYQITVENGQVSVRGTTIQDTLINLERVQFTDRTLALDIDGNAGQSYRLYKAALNRTPDEPGLAGWIKYYDQGGKLTSMAQMFIDSPEFISKYGPLDNPGFINQLYRNVLARDADGVGLQGWMDAMNNGASRAHVLVGFSESIENQANVIGVIRNGIVYTELA